MSNRTDSERLAWLAKSCTEDTFRTVSLVAYRAWGHAPSDRLIVKAMRDAIDSAIDRYDAVVSKAQKEGNTP